jgi:hypothetical protein
MKTKFFIGCLVTLISSTVLAQDFSVIGPEMQIEVEGAVY